MNLSLKMKLVLLILVNFMVFKESEQSTQYCKHISLLSDSNYFNPGSYQYLNQLTSCQDSCGKLKYLTSMLTQGELCFCHKTTISTPIGNEKCVVKCPRDVAGSYCGSYDYYFSFIHRLRDNNLKLKFLNTGLNETVIFDWERSQATSTFDVVDCIWGTVSQQNNTFQYTPSSMYPRICNLVVKGKDAENPYSISNSLSYEIKTDLRTNEFNLTCPEIAEVNKPIHCKLMVYQKKNDEKMKMEILSDGNLISEYQIPETEYRITGFQRDEARKETDFDNEKNGAVIMADTKVRHFDSTLIGFQMHVTRQGVIVVSVLEPKCTGSLIYCESSQTCEVSCENYAHSCTQSEPWCPMCRKHCSLTGTNLTYDEVERITLSNENIGHYEYKLEKAIKVKVGTMFSVLYGGQFLTKIDYGNFKNDSNESNNKFRYLFQAVLTVGYSMMVPTIIQQSGSFDLSTSLNPSIVSTVLVMEPIENVSLECNADKACIEKELNCLLKIGSGSNFNATVDFGDDSAPIIQYHEDRSKMIIFSHFYNQSGDYEISVNVSNAISSENSTIYIFIHQPVPTNAVIKSNSPQKYPTGEVLFSIDIFDHKFPTSASVEINWSESDLQIIYVNSKEDLNFSHIYNEVKKCDLKIDFLNDCNKVHLTTEVEIVADIQGTNATIVEMIQSSMCMDTNVVQINEEFTISISYPLVELVENFVLQTSDGLESFNETKMKYSFQEIGLHEIDVYSHTKIDKPAGYPTKFSILALAPIGTIEIFHDGSIRNVNEYHNFDVEISMFGPFDCMKVNFGDTASLVYYGNLDHCTYIFPSLVYDDYIGPIEYSMLLSHAYSSIGFFSMTATLINCDEESVAISDNVYVGELPCSNIDFVIEDISDGEYCLHSSKEIFINAKPDITCENGTITTVKKWEITELTTNVKINLVVNSNTVLIIPPNTLTLGEYMVNFTAVISGLPIPMTISKSTLFCTKLSPIEAKVTEDISSEITLGQNQTKVLNPLKYSSDPNSPKEIQNPKIFLLCRKESETFPFNISLVLDSFPEANKSNGIKSPFEDKGGCFGDGLYAIKTNMDGSHNLSTSSLINSVGHYYLVAIVGSCMYGPCRYSGAGLMVNVVLGTPPVIFLRCTFAHKCNMQMIDGEQTIVVNSGNNVGLSAICVDSCPPNEEFEIEIYSVVEETEEILEFTDEHVSVYQAMDKSDINILRAFYEDHDTVERFIVSVSLASSSSKLIFQLNRNPINGSCWLQEHDNCLSRSLIIDCDEEWVDPDGGDIISYQAHVYGPGYACIKSATFPSIQCFVTVDNLTHVSIDVVDSDGGKTTVDFYDDIMKNICEPNETRDDDWLLNIQNQGDPEMISAAANLIQVEFDEKLDGYVDTLESVSSEEMKNGLEMIKDLQNEKKVETLDMLQDIGTGMGNSVSTLSTLNGICVEEGISSEVKKKCLKILENVVDSSNASFDASSYKLVNEMRLNITTKILLQDTPEVSVDITDKDLNEITFENKKPDPQAELKKVRASNEKNSLLITDVSDKFFEDAIKDDTSNFETENEIYNLNVFKVPASSYEAMSGLNSTAIIYVMRMEVKNGIFGAQNGAGDIINPKDSTVTQTAKSNNEPFTGENNKNFSVLIEIPRTNIFELPPKENAILTNDQKSVPHRCAIKSFDSVLIKFVPPENESYWFFSISRTDASEAEPIHILEVEMEEHVQMENGTKTKLKYILLKNNTYPKLFMDNNSSEIFVDIRLTVLKRSIDKKGLSNLSSSEVVKKFSYQLSCSTLKCGFYDIKDKKWKTSGVEVETITENSIVCRSSHLTTFGSGLFIKPNTIDFDYVFDNASIEDNLTIYLTVIVSFSIYLLILVWARRQDRKDLEKIGASPLPDNKLEDKYLYEILVFTGSKFNSGTKSNVHFVLSGDFAETKTRHLADFERNALQKSSVDSFIMSTPGPLGNLKYLRIWHDNSGRGKMASWYLNFIVIRDVQTKKKYEFLAHRWFAVELDDGKIDRMLPVSGKEELSEFSHLFSSSSSRNIRDGHLWFSVFLRPPRSRFTRVQRVSSCMALFYLSMLVNIMWYGTTPSQPTSGLKIGPFVLSPSQIGVGIISNLIVFPPSLIIVTLFRKSRRKFLRPSRINEAMERQRNEYFDDDDSNCQDDEDDDDKGNGLESTERTMNTSKPKVERKKKFTFPWWFVYIAWILTFVCIAVSLFFLWAYGIQFGNEKTTKWFTSLMVCFVCSVFLTQPLKVILITFFLSMICKNLDQDEDDADEDEEEPELASDEQWVHIKKGQSHRMLLPSVMNSKEIRKAKEQREKEIKMYAIAREIFSYFMFLWVLLTISYGNRDPNIIIMRQGLENSFLKPGHQTLDFMKRVKSVDKLYTWMKKSFVPEITTGNWYNSQPPFGLKGYINDHNNYLIGVPIFRQVRVKENSCPIHPLVWELTDNCGGYGKIINEQHGSFREYWSNDPAFKKRYEFEYQSARTLKSLPFWGILDWYGGGGYVFPMILPLWGKSRRLVRSIESLESANWIDKSTRAVFFEFAVHNAQVNLFASVTIVVEFQPGGGLIPYYRIDIMRLQRYHTGFGIFILVCEASFLLFIMYFTFVEFRQIFREKRAYFKQIANYIDLSLILIAYFAIGLFVQREILTANLMQVFRQTDGHGYIRFQHVAATDQVLGYMIAFLVFLANLKFLHLLRFNKRLGILSTTLKECASDLSSFGVCLFIVFLSFVQLFYLIFGLHMGDYSTFIHSIESTFSMMLGKFRFHEIQMTSPFLGPFVFFVFGLATSLVLINILLTIVIRTFEEVKKDMSKIPNDYEMVEFIVQRVRKVIGLNKKLKVHPAENVKKDDNDSKDVNEFSNKIDKLLNYVDKVYHGNESSGNKSGFLKKRKKPKVADLETGPKNFDYQNI